MGTYNTKVIDNIIYSKISGELDRTLVSGWVGTVEELESNSKITLHRLNDIREVNVVNLNFDELWEVADHRSESYKSGNETLSAFWVSTALNHDISRMYQTLLEGTVYKVDVFYQWDEISDFLSLEKGFLEKITFS